MNNLKLEKEKNKLYELTLGYSCNSNCRFCSISPEKRHINKTTFEVMNDIKKAEKENFKILGFGGGEPSIRKDILQLIKFAKKLHFQTIRIQTNGFMLAYEDFCKKIVDAGANFFKISIHGHKAEIHDYLTRIPGSFDLILKGIDNLHKLDIRIEANIVLNKINYKFLTQYVNFFANKGIGSFCIIFPLFTGSMALNKKKIGIRISESATYIHDALDLAKSLGLDKALVFNVPYCYMQRYESKVVEEYNMKLIAPDLVIDDADTDIRTGKIKLENCENCLHDNRCKGIWKEYLKIYGDKEFINFKKLNEKN